MSRADEQRHVLRGIMAGSAIILVWFTLAWAILPTPRITDTPGDRLAFALKWDLAVVACLVVAVGLIARQRFFFNRIDGGWDRDDRLLEIFRYNLANTSEQVLIAIPVHLAFAVSAPIAALNLVAAAALLFVLARAAFLIGYLSGRATNRALGFACSFYPSVLLLLAAAVFAVRGAA
jgi:uncharacterized MAPEG superfamily protein